MSHGSLILQIFDLDEHRRVEIQHLGALSASSKRVAKSILDALGAADETAIFSKEKTRG